jgi:hypothetical protein
VYIEGGRSLYARRLVINFSDLFLKEGRNMLSRSGLADVDPFLVSFLEMIRNKGLILIGTMSLRNSHLRNSTVIN